MFIRRFLRRGSDEEPLIQIAVVESKKMKDKGKKHRKLRRFVAALRIVSRVKRFREKAAKVDHASTEMREEDCVHESLVCVVTELDYYYYLFFIINCVDQQTTTRMKPACPMPPELTDPIGEEPIMKVMYFEHRKKPVPSKEVLIMLEKQMKAVRISKKDEARRFSYSNFGEKQVATKKRSRTCKIKDKVYDSCFQFFESINPKSDFRTEEHLENYLYQKSLEIQPKGVDPPTSDAVKPKHTGNTLRSPGVKAPKTGNHYSPGHHNVHSQSSTVTSTPVLFHETKRSFSHTPNDEQFSERKTLQRIAPLQPPPLLPRSRAPPPLNSLPPTTIAPMVPTPKSSGIMTSPSSTPSSSSSSSQAPKLHPRRIAPRSPLVKSPLTPSREHNSSHFQFPDCAAPPLPPRPSTSSESPQFKENSDQLAIFEREDSARSPTVRLSVPLPPALPPPRGTSTLQRPPPPLPPKAFRSSNNSSPPLNQSPSADPKSPSLFVNLPPSGSTPPPLPPKTYKPSRNSS
ncbi:unnamed protein product [Caenorhabditis angaria]|uniref:Uncharacterized protein n=1 Tax=Caenorhabditis angaria TaxID=860376 RepID=A0A9P1N6M5_9PELO|nr:unnamed protein product [Caenorhabditis angaria]